MSDPVRYYLTEDGPVVGTPPGEVGLGSSREGQSFELEDVKWGNSANGTTGGTVTWSFATSNLGIEPESFTLPMFGFFQDEVRAAFDAWEAIADIDFVEVADGEDVNIRFGMGVLDGSVSSGGSTVGTAFYSFSRGSFIQAHIVMDVDDFNTRGDQSGFFLTALHEIGHAIGLDHENDVPSIMSSFINGSLTALTADDISGAQTIYGASVTGSADDLGVPSNTIPGITVSEGTTDAPASTSTTFSLISGDSFEGELDASTDRDWVAIDLTVGTQYTFDLKGIDESGGTLDDPFLVLRNASGGFVAQDDDSGTGLNSQIVFTPESSGTFYLSARGFSGNSGTYTLTTSPEERTDEGGGTTPDPSPGGQTISEGDTDAAGDTSTSAQMSVGDTFQGQLDVAGDRDFVQIDLTAGTQYTFSLQGADSGAGDTLSDPFLILRDDGGTFISQDDDSGTGADSQITFTPSSSGTYYLSVRNFTGDTGTYSLTASASSAAQTEQSAASEGYVTSIDAADVLAILDEVQLS